MTSLVEKFDDLLEQVDEPCANLIKSSDEFREELADVEALAFSLSEELDKAKSVIRELPTEVLEAKLHNEEKILLVRRDLMKPFFPNLSDEELAGEIQNALWFHKLDMTRRSKRKLLKNYTKKLAELAKNDNNGAESTTQPSEDESLEGGVQREEKSQDGEGS